MLTKPALSPVAKAPWCLNKVENEKNVTRDVARLPAER